MIELFKVINPTCYEFTKLAYQRTELGREVTHNGNKLRSIF